MRQVAEQAGVDAALISHYYGSKQGLFLAAVEFPVDPSVVLEPIRDCPVDELGATGLRAILVLWGSEAGPAILARFRHALAADEPEILRGLLSGVILPLLRARVEGAVDPSEVEWRLGLFASQVAGILLTRHLLELPVVAGAEVEDLVRDVGDTLQRYLTGPIG